MLAALLDADAAALELVRALHGLLVERLAVGVLVTLHCTLALLAVLMTSMALVVRKITLGVFVPSGSLQIRCCAHMVTHVVKRYVLLHHGSLG